MVIWMATKQEKIDEAIRICDLEIKKIREKYDKATAETNKICDDKIEKAQQTCDDIIAQAEQIRDKENAPYSEVYQKEMDLVLEQRLRTVREAGED